MFENVVCQICTDVYDHEKSVAAMPCGHTFHDDCLSQWLANTRNCPSCRKPLKKTQHPIHRLFFSIDANASQCAKTSPKSQDPMVLEKNRKLQAQVTALQAAISKLKSECQEMESQKVALTCAISDKDMEIQHLGRNQDKLKRRLREYSNRQDELDDVKKQLSHLQNVQVIVEGVESEVKHMLEDQAGYTPQQLTYVVLLRQQLDNSKRNNDKLKRELTEYRDKLTASTRKCGTAESEVELLKLELKQAETRNINLKKKCDLLIRSMNSPRGAAASLAKRIVNQSPAPDFLTPSPAAGSANQKRARETAFTDTSTTALPSAAKAPSAVEFDTSSDMFNESSAFGISDVNEDQVKQTLDFNEADDYPLNKRTKLVSSEKQPTQGTKVVSNESPSTSGFAVPIKPKSSIKLKAKLKPIKPTAAISSQVRDVTNLPHSSSTTQNRPVSSFRQGFDGMGGKSSTFNRTHNAMQFNVFKKPMAKPKPPPAPAMSGVECFKKYILLDDD